jgi:hypothetical protein
VTATVVTRQYVQGVGQTTGQPQPQSYPYSWQYDLNVACPCCSFTVRITAFHSQPSAELLVMHDQQAPGAQRTVTFYLQDPSTGYSLYQTQHNCSGIGMTNAIGGGSGLNVATNVVASSYSSFTEVDIVGWMRTIEAKLDRRIEGEGEMVRLVGMVDMLADKLKWTTEELHATKGRNVHLAQQIRRIHEALDCPCEMELDSYDLLEHMDEMGISLTD